MSITLGTPVITSCGHKGIVASISRGALHDVLHVIFKLNTFDGLGGYLKYIKDYQVVDIFNNIDLTKDYDWYSFRFGELKFLQKYYPNNALFRKLYPKGEIIGNFIRIQDEIEL